MQSTIIALIFEYGFNEITSYVTRSVLRLLSFSEAKNYLVELSYSGSFDNR